MSTRTASWVADAQATERAGLARRAWLRVLESPAWALLSGVVASSAALHFVLALTSPAPWIVPDELVYSELAKSFAATGHFAVRGASFSAWTYGPLYPLLVAPVYALRASTGSTLVLIQAINCVVLSVAAVPTFLIARRLLDRNLALLAAGLAVLVPSGVYSTKVMTESLAYPCFLFAMLGIVRALEKPSTVRELLALAGIAVAVLARAEMVALLPAYLVATLVVGAADAAGQSAGRQSLVRRLRGYRATWLVTALGAVGVLAALVLGLSVSTLGAHLALVHDFRWFDAPRRLVYHLGDLELYMGVVPLLGFVVAVAGILRADRAPRTQRAFAAAASATAVALLVLTAVYSSIWPTIYDRFVFYLVPLAVIGLLLWIQSGLSRPKRLVVLLGALAAVLPLTLPYGDLLVARGWGTNSSSVGLVPLFWIGLFTGHGWLLRLVVLGYTSGLVWTFVRTGRRDAGSLVRIVVMNFVVITVLVAIGNAAAADKARGYGGSNPPAWVDGLVGSDRSVAVLWTGNRKTPERRSYAIWESEFFNRSIGPVYHLHAPLDDALQSTRFRWGGTGAAEDATGPIRASYVLVDRSVKLAGTELGHDAKSGLTLYRVAGVVRERGR